MITQINQGNLWSAYQRESNQNRFIGKCNNETSIVGLVGFAIPFQIILSGSGQVPTAATWKDRDGNTFPASLSIEAIDTDDNQTILTYLGGGATGVGAGIWTLCLTVGANTYVFEEIKLVDSVDCYQKIAFTSECSLGSVYYENGYNQCWYFKGYADQPRTEIEEQANLNGYNELSVKTRSVKQYFKIQIPNIIDSQINALNTIRNHSTIIYYPDTSGISHFLKEVDVVFTAQDNGCYNQAELSFLDDNFNADGCCDVDFLITNTQNISL